MASKSLRALVSSLALAGLMTAGAPAFAGPDRELTDEVGDAPKSVDLKTVHTTDGDTPTITVNARGLPSRGRLDLAFAEWDENWYRLHIRKTASGLKKTLQAFDPETGQAETYSCDYSVRWRAAKHQVVVRFVRDSCFYEEPGDEYTGFAPQWAKLSSKAGSDRVEEQF